jgi:alpha-glucosidase (family GH31 glycosyl hydrolase)
MYLKFKKTTLLLTLSLALMDYSAQAKGDLSVFPHLEQTEDGGILKAQKVNNTTVEVLFKNGQRVTIDFYGNNIFRLFQDEKGGILRDPIAQPSAEILVQNPRKTVENLQITETADHFVVSTISAQLNFDKATGLLSVINKNSNDQVLEFSAPIAFERNKVVLSLKENDDEYFYGGGVQNGRFSHKGKVIAIENQNSWTDGGVASPTPYYWSTNGYGVMFYTFKKGRYDFGAKEKGRVSLSHETDYLDVFFMINDGAVALLNDFYQLTGNPVLMPKFGFYQGHLNAYNRDFWKEDEKGILFEDGKHYKEEQKDNGGIKESLNGK